MMLLGMSLQNQIWQRCIAACVAAMVSSVAILEQIGRDCWSRDGWILKD